MFVLNSSLTQFVANVGMVDMIKMKNVMMEILSIMMDVSNV